MSSMKLPSRNKITEVNIMGMINAILLDEKDNVVTCVKEVQAGEEVTYRSSAGLKTLKPKSLFLIAIRLR